jgi:hypothetical protein
VRRGFLVLIAMSTPAAASACSVCGQNGPGQGNFLVPTIFLSLLPLAMVGAGLLWLRRRVRAMERVEAPPAMVEAPRAFEAQPLAPPAAAGASPANQPI